MLTGWMDLDRNFAMMDDFRSRMDQLFQEFETGRRTTGWQSTAWPRLNLMDTGDNLVLRAELPGVAREDLQISGCQDALTLSGLRKIEVPEGYSLHRQERAPVRFSRTLTFPVKVEVENTRAELKNGILEITLPKAPEVKPRAIEVKVG